MVSIGVENQRRLVEAYERRADSGVGSLEAPPAVPQVDVGSSENQKALSATSRPTFELVEGPATDGNGDREDAGEADPQHEESGAVSVNGNGRHKKQPAAAVGA